MSETEGECEGERGQACYPPRYTRYQATSTFVEGASSPDSSEGREGGRDGWREGGRESEESLTV